MTGGGYYIFEIGNTLWKFMLIFSEDRYSIATLTCDLPLDKKPIHFFTTIASAFTLIRYLRPSNICLLLSAPFLIKVKLKH
jgi:hypothetical protein